MRPILGHLGLIMAHLEHFLGNQSRVTGLSTSNHVPITCHSPGRGAPNLFSSHNLSYDGASLGHLGPSVLHLGSILGASRNPLGALGDPRLCLVGLWLAHFVSWLASGGPMLAHRWPSWLPCNLPKLLPLPTLYT